MMDILTYNEVKKVGTKVDDLKDSRGLSPNRFSEPCFAVVTVYSSNYWGTEVYDHNLNKIGADIRVKENYNSYYTSSSSELANSAYTTARSDSYTGTGSNRGNGTSMVGHLGHNSIQVAPDGSFSFTYNNKSSQRDVGTWLHSSRPDLTINMSSGDYWISKRTYVLSDNNLFGEATKSIDGLSSNNRYGTISYNEKTKKLAIVESDGSYQHRLNVWDNIEPPQNFDDNAGFFSQLVSDNHIQTNYFTAKPATNGTEDNYRGVVILCDNGDVVVSKMIPSWGFYSFKFSYDDTTNSYTVPTGTLWQQNWTTSYGVEHGLQYGIRFQISNSGKYVIAYAPSYYYGSGYYFAITEVATGKIRYSYSANSSYGYSFVPWGDNDFLMSCSADANGGVGMSIYPIVSKKQFDGTADSSEATLGSKISGVIDSYYWGTNYPYIVPIMNQDYTKFIGEKR